MPVVVGAAAAAGESVCVAVRGRARGRRRAAGRGEPRERRLRRRCAASTRPSGWARRGWWRAARRRRGRCSPRRSSSLGVAAVAGLALALATSPVLILAVGALALVAALLYSGGPRPYAGLGLGELMVFVFFGLMATCGTAFVMVGDRAGRGVVERRGDGPARGRDPRGEQPPRHRRPTRPPASARSRCGSATRATRLLYRACVVGGVRRDRASGSLVVHRRRVGRASRSGRCSALVAWPLAIRPMDAVGHGDGPRADPGARRARPRSTPAFGALLALGLAAWHATTT